MLRYAVLIAAFLLLVVVFVLGLQQDPSELPSTYLGKPAPAFDLPSLTGSGERVNNERLAGEISLINIWATWCVGCREEHAFLMELASTQTVPIYGINWRDDRDDALRWLVQFGDPYVDSGFDGDGRAGIDWGVYGAPETFLVAPDGTVLYKHLGPLTPAIWQREFEPRIAALRSSG